MFPFFFFFFSYDGSDNPSLFFVFFYLGELLRKTKRLRAGLLGQGRPVGPDGSSVDLGRPAGGVPGGGGETPRHHLQTHFSRSLAHSHTLCARTTHTHTHTALHPTPPPRLR